MASPFQSAHGTPSASRAGSVSHGGAEQESRYVFGRVRDPIPNPFGRRLGAHTAPSTPRVRSPDDEDRRSRERRTSQGRQPQEPIGFALRLNAIEQTLRQHQGELVTQKTLIDGMISDKKNMESRLDASFRDWNTRIADMDKKAASSWDQSTSLIQAMSSRIDKLESEFSLMMRTINGGQKSGFGAGPPGTGQPLNDNGPPPPPGFTGGFSNGNGPQTFNMSSPQRQAPSGIPDSWSPLGGQFGAAADDQRVPTRGNMFAGTSTYESNPGHHSAPNPSQSQAGPNYGWAAAGFGTNLAPWCEKDWTVDQKTSKELKVFDGDIKAFDKWRLRIRYHFINTNMYYKDIFDIIEKEKHIINWRSMAITRIPELPNVQWSWVATHIWSFVSRFLGDTMLGRMENMAQNEEFNGIELWRALYLEFMGGSTEMSVNERNCFINFPKCTKDDELQNHLSSWNKLRLAYGEGLPDEHLKIMFRNILPDHVLSELKKQNIDIAIKEYNWVMGELGRFNDTRLSKWNMSKLVQQLKPKNSTSVNQVGADDHSTVEPPAPPVPDMSSFQANLERMVAAAFEKQQDRGRSTHRTTPTGSRNGSRDSKGQRSRSIPSPKFNGCWCCGEEGHSRQKCPKFLAIKAKNGGRVPADYEGAYEKHVKKQQQQQKSVAAIGVKREVPPLVGEHNETLIWPLLTAKGPKFKPTVTKNSFASLSDGTDDEDEAEVVKAFSQLTSNVRRASDRSKPQHRSNQGLDMTRIHALAKQMRDGTLNLPDLELDSNEEYECIWALVDTGAGVNCASQQQFPDAVPVDAPDVLLTTASGDPLPNAGAMKVVTRSKEGVTRERIFYRAPVEIPILSVAEVSQEGPMGSDTLFRRTDGYIEDNQTLERQHFVKRKGVYFTKLYIERRKGSEGFGRLGNHP